MTINGADGTPGADWCLTIATSDSNGGEYIITEHRRFSDQPPRDDNPETKDTKSDAVEVRQARDVNEEDRNNREKGRAGEEGQGRENSEQVKDGAGQEAQPEEGRGQRVQRVTTFPGASERLGDRAEQEHGAESMKHASSPQEEEDNHECSNHGDSGAPREPICTATPPPGTKSTRVQPSEGRSASPSPVTRFARWIVQRATKGEEKHGNAGGKDIHRAPPENEHACSGVDNAPAGSGRQTTSSPRRGVTLAGRLSPAGRTGPSSVTGFKAKRMVQVSMTCPLPTKLPFHPDQREEEFDAPMFGTTVLGNSHGFDPKG